MSLRLGGWWRLWIVGAVIYGAGVIVAQWHDLTISVSGIAYERHHIEKLSDRSLEILAGKTQLDPEGPSSKYQKDPIIVNMPNGAKFDFPGKTSKEQLDEVTKDYTAVLESLARESRAAAVVHAVYIWLVPSLAFLGLGLAIRWIYRGFKKPDL